MDLRGRRVSFNVRFPVDTRCGTDSSKYGLKLAGVEVAQRLSNADTPPRWPMAQWMRASLPTGTVLVESRGIGVRLLSSREE